MKQHCDNAAKVVDYLKNHKAIKRVIYATEHDEEISIAIYVLNNMDLYDAILRGDSIQ